MSGKRIQFKDGGAVYLVVEETETMVTYRRHYSKKPRDFTTVNKKYVKFI